VLQRSVFTVALVAVICGSVHSDTFLATITKVQGNKVTYKKATYHRDKAVGAKYSYEEPVTVEATNDAAITWGHFVPADGPTTTEGRINVKTVPVAGGLKHRVFEKINAGKTLRPSLITTADRGADKGKITAINLWKSASPK
jgi:hypothetical protein